MTSVEIYVGRHDGTWYTFTVEVPPQDSMFPMIAVSDRAMEIAAEQLEEEHSQPAFFGIYHISS